MANPVFEWSANKRVAVLQARGLDFIDGQLLFDGRPLHTAPSDRGVEKRWLSIGELNGRMIAIVWTQRNDVIRIITMRRARAMAKQRDIVRFTADELEAKRRRGESRTDWARVDSMSADELEASIAADPDDVHEEPDWSQAVEGLPPRKEHINIRLDADVLD